MTLGLTFAAGDVPTAAQLQSIVDGVDDLAAGVYCVARRDADQSIANNTNTDVSLDAEELDPFGFFSAPSAVMTVPTGYAGKYTATGWALFTASTTGWRRLAISKNDGTTAGSTSWHVLSTTPGSSADCGLSIVVDCLSLAVGDTVRLKVWHTQGSAINLNDSRLSLRKVAD